ncbi:hypothetical protein PPNK14_09490 [Pectobacterium parmentieri]
MRAIITEVNRMILYHGSTILMLPQDYPHTIVLSGYFYDKKNQPHGWLDLAIFNAQTQQCVR